MIDALHRAVRDGPRAFPVEDGYGTLVWFVGAVCWWRLWAIAGVCVVALGLAYRAMATLGEGWGVLVVLGIGYAACRVLLRISPKYEVTAL